MANETAPLNLVQKLASIRRELKNIEKKGTNAFQHYDYLRAEDIAGEMGDRLAAMNVILARRNLSFVQDNITAVNKGGVERTDVHVIVTLDYVFIDGDMGDGISKNGYAEIAVASIGEGRDSGDKAVAKALTNALKYALTQPLMMRVGDDPEADSEHDKDTGKGVHARVKPTDTLTQAWTDENAAHGFATLAQVAALWKTCVSAFVGDKELATKWWEGRLKELGVTKKTMTPANVTYLTSMLLEFAPKETVEHESDIEF